MARVCCALLLAIVFLAVNHAEGVTLADCKGYYTTVKGCLFSNFGPFFTDAAATTCNGKTMLTSFKEYMLLNLFDPVKQTLNLASAAQATAIAPTACMLSCMFKNLGLLYANNTINYAKFNTLTQTGITDVTTKDVLKFNEDYCQPITQAGKLETIGTAKCLVKPLLHVQCVRLSLLRNVGATFTSTIPCRLAIINIRSCDAFGASLWNV